MAKTIYKNARDNREALANLKQMAARQLIPFAIAVSVLFIFWDRAENLNISGILAGIGHVTYLEWAIAAALSAASFWAVGRYDAVVHRLIKTGINPIDATRAGVTAISLSQSVGLGVVSGALIRWRMLPELSLVQSMRVSITVALSFLAGWAIVAAIAVIISPVTLPFPATPILAWAILCCALILVALSVVRPAALGWFRLPSLRAMGTILLLVLIDTLTAGGALFALLPAGFEIDLPTFLAAFLVALGAGLILGTPGGIGPFEVMLITLLPLLETQSLLSAILAFRIVYYLIPALIGAILVILGPRKNPVPKANHPQKAIRPNHDLSPHALTRLIQKAPEAEAALLRHGRLSILQSGQQSAMILPSNQSLIMLRGPMNAHFKAQVAIHNLQKSAQEVFASPCLYKAPARLAVGARQAGWKVLAIAKEAVINPQTYTINGREFRQLRRKIRKVESAGITLTDNIFESALPLDLIQAVATEWAEIRQGERGFSMGTYDPATLKHARVLMAWEHGELVGFITLHQNPREHVLDLIRYTENAPDGLVHFLVNHAIEVARNEGLSRFSLAALPVGTVAGESRIATYLRQHIDHKSGANGLRQFKACFSPKWETLYLAAPSSFSLVLSAIDICTEITRK